VAVGFVASATSGSQASVASFNIGTLGTGARAGIVFVCIHNSATDIITSVTWNGTSMTLIGKATDTDTEPGVVKAYFLDSVSNGTITVNRTNNSVVTVGYAASISAAMACRVSQYITRVASTQNTNADTSTTGTGASGEVAVDDGSPGTNSMRFAASYTGAATPVAQGTNSSALQSLDSTAFGSSFIRETTAGQGSRNVGFATGTTDDWALVAVAVSENNRNASVTAAGGGVVAASLTTARSRSETDTGGGAVVATKTTARSRAETDTGGGVASIASVAARSSNVTATGAGVLTTSTLADRQISLAATGGGAYTHTYDRSAATENHDADVVATGAGVASVAQATARNLETLAAGGGALAATITSSRDASATATGAGVVAVIQATARSTSSQATGAGSATPSVASARLLAALLSGGGVLAVSQATARSASATGTGGGSATIDGTQERDASASVAITGGGVAAAQHLGAHLASVVATGAGQVQASWAGAHGAAVTTTGGGVATLDVDAGLPVVPLPAELYGSARMVMGYLGAVQSGSEGAAVAQRGEPRGEVTIR
jgi:hypothetical protein